MRILTRMKTLGNRSRVDEVSTANFTCNVTIECFQLNPPFHCHPSFINLLTL